MNVHKFIQHIKGTLTANKQLLKLFTVNEKFLLICLLTVMSRLQLIHLPKNTYVLYKQDSAAYVIY